MKIKITIDNIEIKEELQENLINSIQDDLLNFCEAKELMPITTDTYKDGKYENELELAINWLEYIEAPNQDSNGKYLIVHEQFQLIMEEIIMRKIDNPLRESCKAPFKKDNGKWIIPGELQSITPYTLFYQRMYHKEDDGTWTRPKGGGSFNSIK